MVPRSKLKIVAEYTQTPAPDQGQSRLTQYGATTAKPRAAIVDKVFSDRPAQMPSKPAQHTRNSAHAAELSLWLKLKNALGRTRPAV
jgi:hypothetical protein